MRLIILNFSFVNILHYHLILIFTLFVIFDNFLFHLDKFIINFLNFLFLNNKRGFRPIFHQFT